MRKRKYFLIFFILLFVSAYAQEIKSNDINELIISELSGPTFTYQLIGENFSEKRIINDCSDRDFLPNIKSSCNICISPNKKNIAYVKNVVINPFMDWDFIGQPIVTISNNMGKKEIEIMKCDFDSIVFLTWVDNEKLVISSKEDSLYFITIIDLNGNIIKRFQTKKIYKLKMSTSQKEIVAYNRKSIVIYDIQSDEFQEIDFKDSIDISKIPYFVDSSIIFKCYYAKYLKLNMDDFSYEYVESERSEKYLVYANSFFSIYLNREKLYLYKKTELVGTIDIPGYQCQSGLYITSDNDFYFVGELTGRDDVGAIVKVNLDTGKINRITNHKENQLIINYNCYDF